MSKNRSVVLRLTWRDWLALAEATVWLGLGRVTILLVPFNALSRRLGAHMQESPKSGEARHADAIRRIAWAIGAVSRRAPWRCKCLEQAFAAKLMLRFRRIPNTLYLGVARGETKVEAHAWVRSGDYYLTGGAERARYAVVSTFADGAAR
ncbi:MAG: lasso peptide biosynthesis B2 protein [Acidobacteria bacterium]|nr:lasso peptide biosynthesis B2 protein [Acidobacteriota bacterium]MBV9477505.1 lasso peptide biosynthesis B2 protein [Acidobacteriota bacterium]